MQLAARSNLIFDLDGTLTDPREGITRSMAHALVCLGRVSPPLPALEKYIGPPFHEVFRELLETADPLLIQEGVRFYRERYSDVGLFENFPYEGIAEALGGFRNSGYRLWVCTSKPWVFARRILERFELAQFFEGIYGCELDGTLSNKGELLAHLLEKEGIAPGRSVMIGDRKHDVHAAHANGTRSLGVLYGFGDEAELTASRAQALCSSPAELAAAVSRLLPEGAGGGE